MRKCDDCRCIIPPGQEIETTRSKQKDTPGILGASTTTELITICRSCARRRAFWGWLAGLVVAAIVLGGLAVLFSEILRR